MSTTSRRSTLCGRSAIGMAALAAVTLLGAVPAAASHIRTQADLKFACEYSPGNTVVLDHPTSIVDDGTGTLDVESGCTLVLGPNANLETEVKLIFAGPLEVRSAEKVDIKLTKSRFVAPVITFSLTGPGSGLALSESELFAGSGDLLFILGDEVKMQVKGGQYGYILTAAGAFQITGGQKVLISLAEIAVRAHQGVGIAMNGSNGSFKVDQVMFFGDVAGPAGNIAITSSGPKALVEMHNTDFDLRGNATFTARLAGAESALVLKSVWIGPRYVDQPIGAVTLEVGSGSASKGMIEASASIRSGTLIAIRASLNGDGGVVKLAGSVVAGQDFAAPTAPPTGNIVIETGPNGTTEVMGDPHGASVRVATGPGGSCVWKSFNGRERQCAP